VTGPLELFDPALLELVPEQEAFNRSIMEATAAMADLDAASPEGLAWVRAAMEPGGLFGMTSYDFPEVRAIPGPDGPVPIRILVPDTVTGVYLHLHGGAMTVGSAASMDGRNWDFARKCNVAVVSVDYRLAPEHPFPAGPDDCEAAARWLIAHAREEFGTDNLLIGGESAGAYLAVLTLLRLRDSGGGPSPFLAADLCYGGYDITGTPSRRLLAGQVPYATGGDANRRLYVGDRTDEECRDPAISPLWADLRDLPPCLITVGTADWLIDDNLFLASRLAAAGTTVELAVYPAGPHGIESAPTAMGRLARQRIYDFLVHRLDEARNPVGTP
jgi:acetyl esterase/lipase